MFQDNISGKSMFVNLANLIANTVRVLQKVFHQYMPEQTDANQYMLYLN